MYKSCMVHMANEAIWLAGNHTVWKYSANELKSSFTLRLQLKFLYILTVYSMSCIFNMRHGEHDKFTKLSRSIEQEPISLAVSGGVSSFATMTSVMVSRVETF